MGGIRMLECWSDGVVWRLNDGVVGVLKMIMSAGGVMNLKTPPQFFCVRGRGCLLLEFE